LKKNCLLLLSAFFCLYSSTLFAQTIYTVAGDGTAAYGGDGGPSALSKVNVPYGVATDAAGNIYIADHDNNRIRKINTSGTITTIAGTGLGSYLASQDGGPATAAWIKWPIGIAVDASGNVFFSDAGNNIIRKISTSGIITTIAGTPGSILPVPPCTCGDGGQATAAQLGNPWGVAVDGAGNVLIADVFNNRIRKINTTTGIISTVAGVGTAAWTGDGGQATAAKLNEPTGVAVDGAGNILIADNSNNRVRKVNTSGIISTIAGTGLPYGYTGDGGPATAAHLYYPKGIAVDAPGNVYICDWNNSVVRKINTSGMINTIAGTGAPGYSGDGIAAVSSQLNLPTGIAVRYDGDVFISDNVNNRVRRIKIGNDPYFTWGASKNLTLCPAEFATIDSALKVDDIDVGQTLNWSPVLLPAHGILVATCTALTTGSTVTPACATYAATVGYTGTDSFTVRVNDGTYSDTIKIYVTIVGFPTAGTINGADTICPGHSVTLTDTASGGTWTSSNTAVATVSGGVVSGIVPGTAIISYARSNFCGTATATRTVTVLATVPCITAVSPELDLTEETVSIQPNPNSGQFTIRVNTINNEKIALDVFNVVGQRVLNTELYSGKPNNIFLDQPAGVYFLKFHSGKAGRVEKIIISK